jgi:hypothetical protein
MYLSYEKFRELQVHNIYQRSSPNSPLWQLYLEKKKAEDQYRIKAAELKFMRWTTKYTWTHYQRSQDILGDLHIESAKFCP